MLVLVPVCDTLPESETSPLGDVAWNKCMPLPGYVKLLMMARMAAKAPTLFGVLLAGTCRGGQQPVTDAGICTAADAPKK